MSHRWKPEEDEWLRMYYPDHGIQATLKAYIELYGPTSVTKRAIEHRIYNLGIRLSEKRYREKQLKNGRNFCQKERRAVGYVNPDTGYIKTEKGWKRLGAVLGVPKGKYAVHLDGNKANNQESNIMIISQKVSMKMTANKMWSESGEITKTGIMCCQLEEAIGR